MSSIKVIKQNEVFLKIQAEASTSMELSEYFKFRVPGYMFMPAYKNKLWDGYARLFNAWTKSLYIGLLPYLKEFAEKYGYELDLDPALEVKTNVSDIQLLEFLETLHLPHTMRNYQLDATLHAINHERALLVSPTASGKSLIIYALTRWFNAKTLIIVPTINLVLQMLGDFKDYSKNDPDWKASENVHTIHAGKDKNDTCSIYVSTWQSLYKMPKDYFEQFDVIFGDEAHTCTAKSLMSMMEKCTNTKYRFGTTGTIKGAKTDKMVLEGLFGPLYQVTTSKDLMDQNYISKLKINCLNLTYPEEFIKRAKRAKYQDEIRMILEYEPRNKFIRNLACGMKTNTLVLFQYVNKQPHGRILYEMILAKVRKTDPDRKVFFIYGGTDKEVREEVRGITEKETNAIILASVGVYSTGINIKNLFNIIFAHPSKSRIRVLQSIGRGLRIGDYDTTTVWDLVDNLCYKSYKNYTMKHFLERVEIYNEQKFYYRIYNADLK